MQVLDPEQRETLRPRLLSDRPGPMVGLHVIETGHGACFGDRWPEPRCLLSASGENFSLIGDPEALQPEDLDPRIAGLLDAPPEFAALLIATFDEVGVWDRRIFQLSGAVVEATPVDAEIRPLGASDAHHVYALTEDSAWISSTWGGPFGLCAGGLGLGAFLGGRLASVAVPFYVGQHYEDIGVVTEPGFRGRGLSAACVEALATAIVRRGRRPSWSTSPDNLASLRVAEKLGFELDREDQLYVIRADIPEGTAEP